MDYQELVEEATRQISSGVFLVSGQQANPMTIGWAQWGCIWGKPVLTVMVRHSRYSHSLLEDGRFTVSVPAPGGMKEELKVCGTKSGRDVDKKTLLSLKTVPAKKNGIPGIAGCAIHFECKTLLKTEVSMEDLEPELYQRFYNGATQATPDGDPHTLYFGEILAAYRETK